MQLEEITLALFAVSNSVRVLAYVPQIHKAAIDKNGASAISRTTWSLFLVAHVSTIAYALVNRSDPWLALCSPAMRCAVLRYSSSRGGRAAIAHICRGPGHGRLPATDRGSAARPRAFAV